MPDKYIGRFAPTPSGPLHFGSVVAALGSFLEARKHSGQWLLRIEDIDTPRVQEGAADAILTGLEKLGLYWDGPVVYQSQRLEAYQTALDSLFAQQLTYLCSCPRKLTKGRPYPGTCRNGPGASPGNRYATRLKTDDAAVVVKDALQETLRQCIRQQIGDFILKRSDQLFAYHLALVVDDAWQDISHVVRGVDLWDSTPRQVYLQKLLTLNTPYYCHLPIAVNERGRKISKTNHAQAVLLKNSPAQVLLQALAFLGQEPDASLVSGSVEEIINWSIEHWQLEKVPRTTEIPYKES